MEQSNSDVRDARYAESYWAQLEPEVEVVGEEK